MAKDEGGGFETYGPPVLSRRLNRIIKAASSKRITQDELTELRAFIEGAIADSEIEDCPFGEEQLTLLDSYARGEAVPLMEIVSMHDAVETMALWRIEQGLPTWPERREQGLDILARMAKEITMTPALTAQRRGAPPLPSDGGKRRSREPDPTFGSRLVAARQRAGLTQTEVAAKLKTSPGVVRNWEHDRTHPQPYRLTMLCRVLHCTRQDLTG